MAPAATITVYPRACGGTHCVGHLSIGCIGLSPRLRGNQYLYYNTTTDQRSIPALAGEPLVVTKEYRWDKVYPRACGGTRRT